MSNAREMLEATLSYLENRPMFFSLLRPFEVWLMRRHLTEIKPMILDYGCGDGFFAKQVFGKKKVDIGLDVFDSRLNQASVQDVYKKTVSFDGKTIPFKSNTFSGVISNSVLEHIPDLDYSIAEIHRVMKKNSIFLTTVMTDKWEENLLGSAIFGDLYKRWLRKKQQHFNLLTVDQWSQKFMKVGFRVKKVVTYLPKDGSRLMELLHFFSLPSLVTYKLFGQWVIIKKWYSFFSMHKLIEKYNRSTQSDESEAAAVFFVLQKR
ncbi:MAG: class I SAM-dependent methyltransferase [Patescibacteria group bacterium]